MDGIEYFLQMSLEKRMGLMDYQLLTVGQLCSN